MKLPFGDQTEVGTWIIPKGVLPHPPVLVLGAIVIEMDFPRYAVVALLEDLPAHGLLRGHVGTVVEVWQAGVFEVEFVDSTGRTFGLVTLRAEQLMLLHHDQVAA